jgi:hypothetical protein
LAGEARDSGDSAPAIGKTPTLASTGSSSVRRIFEAQAI